MIYMDPINDIKKLGTLMRKTRKEQRITQEQLAAIAGVGTRFVRELEQGKGSCQVGKVLQVAQTLGIIICTSTRLEITTVPEGKYVSVEKKQ